MAGGLSLRSRKIRMDRGICNLGKKRKLLSTVCCPARQAGEGGGPQRGGDCMRPCALPLHPALALPSSAGLGSHPIRGEAAGRRASFTESWIVHGQTERELWTANPRYLLVLTIAQC